MAYINVFIKGTEGYTSETLEGDRVTVGRSSKCGITIRHNSVSREHCVFTLADEVWGVEDAGSANGTRVNQDKLDSRHVLVEDDIVKVGKARLKFHAAARPKSNGGKGGGLSLGKDDLAPGGDTPVVETEADDPAAAVACKGCAIWFSVAHRLPGDRMSCPRCGREIHVPTFAATGEGPGVEAASQLDTQREVDSAVE